MDIRNAQPFEYEPLKSSESIRLLILHPGIAESPIHISLIETTLSECRADIYEQYTALSYVWGSRAPTTTIFVNGQSLEIALNLSAALRHLRDGKYSLRLWADAICIDQNNVIERSEQVTLMEEIYSLAMQTIVYLGESNEEIERIFNDMQNSPRRFRRVESQGRAAFINKVDVNEMESDGEEWIGWELSSSSDDTDYHAMSEGRVTRDMVESAFGDWNPPFLSEAANESATSEGESESSIEESTSGVLPAIGIPKRVLDLDDTRFIDTASSKSSSISNEDAERDLSQLLQRTKDIQQVITTQLLTRPWFLRVWVFQELVLSKSVWIQCGRSRVKWEDFCELMLSAEVEADATTSDPRTMIYDLKSAQEGNSGLLLLSRMDRPRKIWQERLLFPKHPQPLVDILLARRGSKATDPRDMIYGHLGIAGIYNSKNGPWKSADLPSVDYRKSINEVFEDATRFIITSSQSLDVLLHVETRIPSSQQRRLPSWVPDWYLDSSHYLAPLPTPHVELPQSRGPPNRSAGAAPRFNSGMDTPEMPLMEIESKVLFYSHPSTIAFKALRRAKVETVSPIIASYYPELDFEDEFLGLADEKFDDYSSYGHRPELIFSSRSREVSYQKLYRWWQAELGHVNLPSYSSERSDWKEYWHFWDDFHRIYYHINKAGTCNRDACKPDHRWSRPYPSSQEFHSIEEALMRHPFKHYATKPLSGRRVAKFQEGYYGIVPATTTKGDFIYCTSKAGYGPTIVLSPLSSQSSLVISEFLELPENPNRRYFKLKGHAWIESPKSPKPSRGVRARDKYHTTRIWPRANPDFHPVFIL